jgi:hypothetical protein
MFHFLTKLEFFEKYIQFHKNKFKGNINPDIIEVDEEKSRELGIPCAVAVENATKLLKDSDLVVLDAREIPAIVYKKENANILKILRE